MILVILPNQLLKLNNLKSKDLKDLKNINEIILVEHPYYFTRFKFHKLKLAFLVSAMKNYMDYLKENFEKDFQLKITYITFDKYDIFSNKYIKKNIIIHDPIDLEVKKEFANSQIIESSFLLKNKDLETISYKRFNAFYNKTKQIIKENYKLDFTKLENQDKLNRKAMPAKEVKEFREIIPTYTNLHYEYAIKYVNKNFKNNFGELSIDNLSELAVTFKDAKKHLNHFIKNRLDKFGPYQDFTSKNHKVLYHSNISYLLNSGLLTPIEVLKDQNLTKHIKPQSLEGFIRQIIWREFMRYVYVKYPIQQDNFWKSKKKINWRQMYGEETSGFDILDTEINKLKVYAWNHHIVRLAVFLNYFVLTEIDPNEINKWFQEVIALDSYEWVMISNIWIMGYYTKGFSSKPYYLSSNYLNRMTNYKIEPKWDKIYKSFVEKKKDFKYYRY